MMSKTRTVSGLLLVSLLLILLSDGPAQVDNSAAIGAALQSRDFDQALELLKSALRQTPENDILWTMQGVALSGKGQNKEALASFRHALKIAPDNVRALEGAVQIGYEAGDPSVIPLLKRLLRLRPNDQTSHGMLAVLAYQQGDCPTAVNHFAKAGSLLQSQLPAVHAYATCLVKLKKLDEAVEVFEKALALNPQDAQERRLLASVQVMAHKPQDAVSTLAPLLANDSADANTLEMASAAYEDTHETDKAVDTLRRAILLDPKNVNLYLDFAAISATHQSFQVGINVVNEGIQLQPRAAPLYFARGVLYVQLADYDKAQADFETAYQLDPTQSLSTAAQGLAAAQQNDLDRALASVQDKLAKKPHDPILLYVQADVLTQKGAEPGSPEFETALHSAEEAVALRPTLGPARAVLAKLYLQSGKYADAAVQCRKVLEIDPKDQTSLYHLIQALRKSGKTGEIPELLKRLALLRQDATKEEREQYRYKLVEGDPQPN
jgi:tetratricopeptide (TPR) repeat protein